MRILFLGTPDEFTARALWSCLDAGYEVCEFWYGHRLSKRLWRDDRRLGWFNPGWSVSAALTRHGVGIRSVPPLRNAPDFWRLVREIGATALVSCEFPYIVPAEMLAMVDGRAVNLHPSLLPAYRGPSPILGILHGEQVDRCGGVTLHEMVPELDAGAIVDQRPVPWNPLGFRHWEADLCRAAGALVRESLPRYLAGGMQMKPQESEDAVYFRSVDAESMRINCRRTARRAKHLLETIGSYCALRAEADGRSWKLAGFLGTVEDHPTGAPPRVGPTRIEMDVADARVLLRRWLPGTSKIRRWRKFQLFSRLHVA